MQTNRITIEYSRSEVVGHPFKIKTVLNAGEVVNYLSLPAFISLMKQGIDAEREHLERVGGDSLIEHALMEHLPQRRRG